MNADELKKADEIVRALRGVAQLNDKVEPGSLVAKLCSAAADLVESQQAQLSDYHHMEQLVDGKMAENQRLRQINENLQSQLAASRRREKAAVVLRNGKNPDGTIRCSCPTCGRLFQEEAFVESYCPDCGQRLTLSGPQDTEKGDAE